jgi:hypothetical protein
MRQAGGKSGKETICEQHSNTKGWVSKLAVNWEEHEKRNKKGKG